MDSPNLDSLGTFTKAICQALAARKKNTTPTQSVLDLIEDEHDDDLKAYLWHLAHYAPDKITGFPGWDFFDDWDLGFNSINGSEHGVTIGVSAGGAPFVAAIRDGKTVILDAMDGMGVYCDDLESFWWELLMHQDDQVDPAIKEFTPDGEVWEWV